MSELTRVRDSSGNSHLVQGQNGDMNVAPNGAVTAVTGATKVHTLDANTAAGSGDGATEHLADATGWKGFTVDVMEAVATATAVMVAWSTTVDDEVALKDVFDALRTDLGTPDATAHDNCFIITANTSPLPVVLWDGTTSIKTIAVAAVGAAYDAAIRTVG